MILHSLNRWKLRDPRDPRKWLERLPHQHEFAMSEARQTALVGGWGSAKTVGLLCFADEAAYDNPGCTGIIMQPTNRLLKEFMEINFRPAFRDLIIGEKKVDNIIYLRGDRRVIFISGHVPERLEMYDAAWAIADEFMLLKHSIFMRLAARVRVEDAVNPRIGYCGTPYYGWGRDEFEGKDDEQRKIIHARTADNPHLREGYEDDLRATCPARLADAYLNGLFVAPGGSVYPEYDEEKHRTSIYLDYRHTTIPAVDWSPRAPHCLLWTMIPDGMKVNGNVVRRLHPSHKWAGMVCTGEIIPDGTHVATTTANLGAMIRGHSVGYNCQEYVCDPAGVAAEMTSGMDNVRILCTELGLKAKYAKRSSERLIMNGVDVVKWLLEPRDKIPRLYIHDAVYEQAKQLPPHLRNRSIVNAFPGYGYPEIKEGKPVDSNPVKDGVTDHAMDTTRYPAVAYFPSARLMIRTRKAA